MAASDADVEHLLASKSPMPILQLRPDLPDQAKWKVHGEVTITWPYNSLAKSFAFLIAEPDFRLRHDRGQVRIQLTGPSAEAVGGWELGSGDEVTLLLDGVEWAKDEEPARPLGSRLDWQLKFTGKLILKAILGETQETKFVNIDQPVATEPNATQSVPLAEIDTTISDAEPVVENPPPARPAVGEFASPIFMKRSRASYGPLFELDLDDELEEDGGTRRKGRKRPRYSVQNARWTIRDDSNSPEPELSLESSLPTREQDGDALMQNTPTRPQMTDGECQTDETDLPPALQSSFNTPPRGWNRAEASPLDGRVPGRFDSVTNDMGVQASPPRPKVTATNEQHPVTTSEPNVPNPFFFAPSFPPSFSHIEAGVQGGFGLSQVTAPRHIPTNQTMQASSLFGTGPAPTQPPFSPESNIGAGLGVIGGPSIDSLRFGFGQHPQSAFRGMPFAPSQHIPAQYYEAHSYPESSLNHQSNTDHASPASHLPRVAPTQNVPHHQGSDADSRKKVPTSQAMMNNQVPLWSIGDQTLDSSHAIGRLDANEDLRSDGSIPQRSPPGMIPPEVEDGTRNADEMREEGIVSETVQQQGVPRQALPDREDQSADEGEDLMDTDEEADYDEDEKGDDYDLRNYDRVSDDQEGFDSQEGPLPDGELMDEDEDFDGDEEFDEDEEDSDEDYDENDDVEEHHHLQEPRPALQPPVQKERVVIDLLSDSEDEVEEENAHKNRVAGHQFDGPVNSEPEGSRGSHMASENQQFANFQPWPNDSEAGQKSKPDTKPAGKVSDDEGETPSHGSRHSDEEGVSEYEDNEEDVEGSEDVADEPHPDAVREDANSIGDANVTIGSVASVAEVEEAATPSPGRTQNQEEIDVEEHCPEEVAQDRVGTTEESHEIQQQLYNPNNKMDVDGGSQGQMAESFQTQTAEMAASFPTQMTEMTATDLSQSSQGEEPSQGSADENVVMREADAADEDEGSVRETDSAEVGLKVNVDEPSDEVVDLLEVEEEQDDTDEPAPAPHQEGQASDAKTLDSVSGEQQKAPPSPPVSQHRGAHAASKAVDISMTTISSHIETQTSDRQPITFDTEETEMVISQSEVVGEEDLTSVTGERKVETVEAVASPAKDVENEHGAHSVSHGFNGQIDRAKDLGSSEAEPEHMQQEIIQAVAEHLEEGEDFHDASEVLEADRSSSFVPNDDRASFVTATSQASEPKEAEEAESASTAKPRRKGRKAQHDPSFQVAKSLRRGQRLSSEQSPGSPMATRSMTMSFQRTASPASPDSQEDMSIRLARAALKTPSKRKASANTANRLKTDLLKRLDTEMPECVPLKVLNVYNKKRLDVVAIATSAHTPPQRTKARQYASSFTVTDPSIAPDGVIEVSLFRAHKDFLPIVKPGDSVLLRGFTVTALAGKGFGLHTHPEESSWAVFDTDGDDALPQIRGPPVELEEAEKTYLVDLRGWYAALDKDAKERLTKAAGEMVDKGRESREEK